MISFTHKGNFENTTKYLKKMKNFQIKNILEIYGRKGVEALSKVTPVDTGLTANSWSYRIEQRNNVTRLVFLNSNINKGVPIAIVLQYGHGTRNGGWVEGRDYINPALQPIFDELIKQIGGEISKI